MLNLGMFMVIHMHTNLKETLNNLRVLQVCDSNFPIGSFNHSYGMETYLRLNKIHNTETFKEWLNVFIYQQFIFSDALAIKLLYEYLKKDKYDEIWSLDRKITVQSVAKETREGGKLVAGRMIRLFNDLYDFDILKLYEDKIKEKEVFGHPAIVFGMLMYSFSFTDEEAISYHMYSTISTLIANGVRAIPLGQKDGQILLKEFSEKFNEIYDIVLKLNDDDFGANSPGLELSQIKHETMEFRLFMS